MFLEQSTTFVIGWTVLHFLWEGAAIGLVTALILRCLNDRSSQTRYLVGCAGLGTCLLAFLSTFQLQSKKLNSTEMLYESHAESVSAANILNSNEPFILNSIVLIWLLGVFLMLARFCYQCYWAHIMRTKKTTPPDKIWNSIFQNLKDELKIPSSVRLLCSGIAQTPMVVGWFTPIVLVPASAFVSLTPDQMRSILAHELAHIHRLDHWMNMLQGIIEILLFFHPAVWWISSQVNQEREFCCDKTSINTTGNPKILAEALAQLESLRMISSGVVLSANGGSLIDRISRILGQPKYVNKQNKTQNMKIKTLTTIVATLCLSAGIVVAQHGPKKGDHQKDSHEKIAHKSEKSNSSAKKEVEKSQSSSKSESESKSQSASKSSSNSKSKSSSKSDSKSSSSSKSVKSESKSQSNSKSKSSSNSKSVSASKSESKSSSASKSGSMSKSNSDSKSKSSKAKSGKQSKKNKKAKPSSKDKKGNKSKKSKSSKRK